MTYELREWGIEKPDHYESPHRFAVTQRQLFEGRWLSDPKDLHSHPSCGLGPATSALRESMKPACVSSGPCNVNAMRLDETGIISP